MPIRFNLSKLCPLRWLLAAFVAGVLFLSTAFPAAAISSTPSDPTKGEAPINDIYEKSEDVLKVEPRTQGELKDEAERGLNEVQGAADIDKMNTPENSDQAVTAKEQVERALEKITGRD
jgi:hypothetical protein